MPEHLRRELNDDWLDGWFQAVRRRGITLLNQFQFFFFVGIELRHFFFQHERDQKQPVKSRAER